MNDSRSLGFLNRIDRVVVINDSTLTRGGATGLADLSARLLRQQGVEVTYFAGDQGDIDGELRALGIDALCLGDLALLKGSKASSMIRGLFNAKAFRAMEVWIRENDTPRTVYHLHGWQQILSPSIFGALKKVSSRTLLHAHDYFLICPNGGQMNYVTNTPCALRPMSLRCMSTNCDKRNFGHKVWRVGRHQVRNLFDDLRGSDTTIALIQRRMVEAFQSYGIRATNLIDLPNPSSPFSQNRVPAEQNNEFHFVGRLVEEKGISELLAAAKSAGVPVRVMGDGPLLETLTAKYPEAIFEGWCGRDRLAELVQRARMIVVPSLYPEPFGLVVPEATSSGIPVLISETALLALDVVAGDVGLTVNPNDPAQFSDLLRACAGDDRMIEAMSLRGFKNESGMSMNSSHWITRLLEIYRTLPGMVETVSG